jgi:hypothetical protein
MQSKTKEQLEEEMQEAKTELEVVEKGLGRYYVSSFLSAKFSLKRFRAL